MMVSLNYWAILVAAVVNMVIGMVYYSPMAFGGLYGKLMGRKSTDMKIKGYEFPVQFVASLVLVYVLAHFLGYAGAVDWIGGAMGGFWAWLGFIAATSIAGFLWEGQSFNFYLLTNGEFLIMMLVSGAILGAWR